MILTHTPYTHTHTHTHAHTHARARARARAHTHTYQNIRTLTHTITQTHTHTHSVHTVYSNQSNCQGPGMCFHQSVLNVLSSGLLCSPAAGCMDDCQLFDWFMLSAASNASLSLFVCEKDLLCSQSPEETETVAEDRADVVQCNQRVHHG